MGTVSIRKASIEDLAPIQDTFNYYIDHTNDIYDKAHRDDDYMKDWWEVKENNGFPIFIAEVDGKYAGFATYGSFRRWDAYEVTVEHCLYLNPEFQRMGIGRMLLEGLIDDAKANGFHSMIAGTDAKNSPSIDFHKKFGFKIVAEVPEVAYKNGERLTLILMQKML